MSGRAWSRRPDGVGLLALCLLWVGCATTGASGAGGGSSVAPIQDPPARPELPSILIAMPSTSDFVEVRRGLVGEVQKNFNVSTLIVSRETSVSEVAAAVDRVKPVCAVLMNNATLNLFHAYEAIHKDRPALPMVVVMASFLDEILGKLRRATGISFEVPGVTAFVNLRAIVDTPIHRVGVVYRPIFKAFVDGQRELAIREHVSLVGRELPKDFSADELRAALNQLLVQDKVDALWMLNDNLLVRDAQFLEETWRAELRNFRLPLIVGVPNLVDPAATLGTLAVVPDYEALGLQTGNLLFDLAEGEWQVERHKIDLPLSVKTIVDMRQTRERFSLRADGLSRIDKALE